MAQQQMQGSFRQGIGQLSAAQGLRMQGQYPGQLPNSYRLPSVEPRQAWSLWQPAWLFLSKTGTAGQCS